MERAKKSAFGNPAKAQKMYFWQNGRARSPRLRSTTFPELLNPEIRAISDAKNYAELRERDSSGGGRFGGEGRAVRGTDWGERG